MFTEAQSPQAVAAEPRDLIAALIAAVMLGVRKYLKRKADARPELMSRADFYAEMRDISDRSHADHLALLEKLDANHRELLAALERQSARISALEAGFARLDERTRK